MYKYYQMARLIAVNMVTSNNGRFYDAPGSWAGAYSRGADPKMEFICSANASSLMIGVAPW